VKGKLQVYILLSLLLDLLVMKVSLENWHRYGGLITKASVVDQVVDDPGLVLDAI
jgi:hypothetical protein